MWRYGTIEHQFAHGERIDLSNNEFVLSFKYFRQDIIRPDISYRSVQSISTNNQSCLDSSSNTTFARGSTVFAFLSVYWKKYILILFTLIYFICAKPTLSFCRFFAFIIVWESFYQKKKKNTTYNSLREKRDIDLNFLLIRVDILDRNKNRLKLIIASKTNDRKLWSYRTIVWNAKLFVEHCVCLFYCCCVPSGTNSHSKTFWRK